MAVLANSFISSAMLPNVTSTTFCTSARSLPSSSEDLVKLTNATVLNPIPKALERLLAKFLI